MLAVNQEYMKNEAIIHPSLSFGHYKEKRDRERQRKRGEKEEEEMFLEGEWIEELLAWMAWGEGLKSLHYNDYQFYQ